MRLWWNNLTYTHISYKINTINPVYFIGVLRNKSKIKYVKALWKSKALYKYKFINSLRGWNQFHRCFTILDYSIGNTWSFWTGSQANQQAQAAGHCGSSCWHLQYPGWLWDSPAIPVSDSPYYPQTSCRHHSCKVDLSFVLLPRDFV